MAKAKNTQPEQKAASDENVQTKEVAGLTVQTNMKVVDNTHEPSDTKPRTAKTAKKGKIAGFDVVNYL